MIFWEKVARGIIKNSTIVHDFQGLLDTTSTATSDTARTISKIKAINRQLNIEIGPWADEKAEYNFVIFKPKSS